MKRLFGVLLALVVGVLGGAVVMGLIGRAGLSPFGTSSQGRNTQIVNSIEREEKIVLVSLGIEGLAEEEVASSVLGRNVPGTGRAVFLQYSYRAMLGIDGGNVTIEETGENQFRVKVAEFIFIGHSDEQFRTVVDDRGLLSFVTPEIDTAALITEVLSEQAKAQHIQDNQDLLEDQARAFYEGIIHGVAPEVTIEFSFPSSD